MSQSTDQQRQLPLHHITIRVPWHDNGWNGSVCARPTDNSSCLILPRIAESRNDETEQRSAGRSFKDLREDELPPCFAERAGFMAPFPTMSSVIHPYQKIFPATHGHFARRMLHQPPYSASCVPFRWMLRANVEGDAKKGEIGLAERLKLDWVSEREPDIRNQSGEPVKTSWLQERDNQAAVLNTFFGALRPQESLCFFYAKRTPLSEQSRRVIIGVGRVLSVGDPQEHAYTTKEPPLRSMIWERSIGHSVRPAFSDGFLFPYQEVLALAEREGLDPEEYVAFAPDEHFGAYSYAAELLNHDGAVASLIACAAALQRTRGIIEGPWDRVLAWIDSQLNRLWQARGAYPGLGSALSAFGYEWGFQHGTLLAYEIELLRERTGIDDAWQLVDAVMADPSRLSRSIAPLLPPRLRAGWQALDTEQHALLQLLARCALTEDQALRLYDATKRKEAGITATPAEMLSNPYLLFELDRAAGTPTTFAQVDRGLFPDERIRREFPLPPASQVDDPVDARRVRALIVDLLETAAAEGHTLLPRSWLIQRARERALQPPCPLGENVIAATAAQFAPIVQHVLTRDGEPAYQIDRLAECRRIIRREILGRKDGRPHSGDFDWRRLVDVGLNQTIPSDEAEALIEERARQEKAAALEQLYRGRLSVLIGSAGTGKTTLLRLLCNIPEVKSKGLLLLAPTGKARVRLEEQTGLRGSGLTLAQFLHRYRRYNGETGAYFPKPQAPRCGDYRTVIVDECSMLTEEQLAALIDTLTGVERLILVGDPRQLPPIGAGRPFVDVVRLLEPTDAEGLFPRSANGYAELTITRRQRGESRADVLLATQFSGRPTDPGADAVFDVDAEEHHDRLRYVQWNHPNEVPDRLVAEMVHVLDLEHADDELGFEESLGGARYGSFPWAFFWSGNGSNRGAAERAEAWQILSPVRAGTAGVDAINRMVQSRFRREARRLAETRGWSRKIPRPFGKQLLLYGDKVMNVVNQRRKDVWPKPATDPYIANGDIGMVVGQYKTKTFKGMPWKLEVEFAGQSGIKYGFTPEEFGDEGTNPLELAYCLTVHKTQGSEFGVTFVVLTNPSRLLSRELLYTALTRHKDRLVILHQGPLHEYRRYAGSEYSDIARRMTNLFNEPAPREVFAGTQQRFLEDGLIHRTERGELVRSKSELIIADKLHANGIQYSYEQPLVLADGRKRFPDFTIEDHARGRTFYWEHLGLLGYADYRARWEEKLREYRAAGIELHENGGGEAGTLIVTADDENGGIDAAAIRSLIDQLCGQW